MAVIDVNSKRIELFGKANVPTNTAIGGGVGLGITGAGVAVGLKKPIAGGGLKGALLGGALGAVVAGTTLLATGCGDPGYYPEPDNYVSNMYHPRDYYNHWIWHDLGGGEGAWHFRENPNDHRYSRDQLDWWRNNPPNYHHNHDWNWINGHSPSEYGSDRYWRDAPRMDWRREHGGSWGMEGRQNSDWRDTSEPVRPREPVRPPGSGSDWEDTSGRPPARPEPPRGDPPRNDPPRNDPGRRPGGGSDWKPGEPRRDPPRNDPPRNDPPRNDPPRQEPGRRPGGGSDWKPGEPRRDPPRNDPPRNDPPRSEPPRNDPPRDGGGRRPSSGGSDWK